MGRDGPSAPRNSRGLRWQLSLLPPLPEAASQHAAGPGQPEQVVAYGQFVEQQVRRTRGQVKWVELSTGIVTLVIGVLLYLMAVVLLDRLMPLGLLGRWLALGGLLGGAGLYCIFGLLPPLLRSVNPIYAAQTLEQSTPALKNSLVNLLFLRGSRQGVSKSVLKAVEQQAGHGPGACTIRRRGRPHQAHPAGIRAAGRRGLVRNL